jgi:hypothetical protein
MNNARTQAKIRAGRGNNVPPINKQFGQEGGNKRGKGFFKVTETPRYKIEKMLNEMGDIEELQKASNGDDGFTSTLARILIQLRNLAGKQKADVLEIKATFETLEKMINQVYGTPKNNSSMKLSIDKPLIDNISEEELDEIFHSLDA